MDLHILAVSEDSLTLTVGKPWKSKWPTWSLWQNFKEKFEFSLEFSLNSCLFFFWLFTVCSFRRGWGSGPACGFLISHFYISGMFFCLTGMLQKSMCDNFKFLIRSHNLRCWKSAWPRAFHYKDTLWNWRRQSCLQTQITLPAVRR